MIIKTALSILQSVRRRMNLTVPSTLLSLTDPDELQLLEILYATCEELRQARCWDQQKKTYAFATVSGQAGYQLPPDFYAPLPKTLWNEDDSERLVGPLSDGDFSYHLYGEVTGTDEFVYRIFGPDHNPNSANGQFVVYPTPSSAVNLRFEYLSSSLFLPKNWLPSTAYTSGTYVNANGNIYLCDTNGTSGATAPTGITTNITDGTTRWDYFSSAYETIIADTDLCIFDADLVKLGVRAKWYEEKGGDYEAAKYEFEKKIDRAKARLKGSHVGSFCGGRRFPRYTIPSRSWSI